jgi:uncharacterized metal-binding protein YceD (DUF177 family)
MRFEIFDYDEFENSDIKVKVLEKRHHAGIDFQATSAVNVPCDPTSEDFDLPIEGEMKLIVRFMMYTIVTMKNYYSAFGEFEIDVAQYIYEMIVLSVP